MQPEGLPGQVGHSAVGIFGLQSTAHLHDELDCVFEMLQTSGTRDLAPDGACIDNTVQH